MNPLARAGRRLAGWSIAGGSALCALLGGCASYPPLPTVAEVDLSRFMGDWYVIAHIPASSEAAAFNAVESYRLEKDGTIATTYTFRDGGFDKDLRVLRPNAVVWDETTKATWGMQFFWPLRFEYLVTYLDPEYQTVIVARSRRDYAWVMARRPDIGEAELAKLVHELGQQGYDVSKVRFVPQRWPDPGHPVQWGRSGFTNRQHLPPAPTGAWNSTSATGE